MDECCVLQAEEFYSLNEEVAAAAAAATAAGAGGGEGAASSDLASYSLQNNPALTTGVLPPRAQPRRVAKKVGRRGGKAKLTLFG